METMESLSLEPDEFLIIKDDSCQLTHVYQDQTYFHPALLYLTNRRVYIAPSVPNVESVLVSLDSIQSVAFGHFNDVLGLKIVGSSTLSIFLPDPDHQESFSGLISKLAAAAKSGQIDCDSLSLSLQRRFIQSQSISEFYQLIRGNEDHLVDSPPIDAPQHEGLRSSTEALPVRLIDFLNDLICADEYLTIGFFFTIFSLLSILFYFIPFGVFSCGTIFLLMLRQGFNMIFSKRPRMTRQTLDVASANSSPYRKSLDQFLESFSKRIMWRNPRQTLETVMFLVSTATMFFFCDPAFVLLISLVGLSFVERWNPVGFGSISEIFANLFTF
jgi:hypothetical protein